ncbi:MAG TPA: type IV pilus assembly protein PilM, partial [Tepidisphaeraceae bacterium]|nr:type IV pilus assembly protein PilM [Tepidisphaeraceae bacterium]
MANPRFAWGIDIGNRALKAIKLVREGDALRIDDVEVIEHEQVLSNSGDNREGLIQTALANFASRHETKGGVVAIGVSGQSSFARFIKLPPVEKSKIPEIVRFEAIQQIPFPLDDVEWSYQLFEQPDSPDVEVGIFAMRKELVNSQIKYFTDLAMNVQVVQMNPLAVYNAAHYDNRLRSGATMILDLGAENADLIIADKESVWLRSISIGGNNFTEALVKAFKLNFAKAEDLKRNAQTSKYARQIFQAMRPIFADLVAEIQRSIGFYSSVHRDSRIKRIIALGNTFRLPTLQKYLQQNLQIEVERLDTFKAGAPVDGRAAAMLSDNIASMGSAYGLAVQAMGQAKIESSLLPAEIRKAKIWQEKTKWFAAAAALFVAGAGVMFGNYYYHNSQFESAAAKDAQRVVDEAIKTGETRDREWAKLQSGDEAMKIKTSLINTTSLARYRDLWADLWIDVTNLLPAENRLAPDKIKPTLRKNRKQVYIESVASQYQADISHVIKLTPEEFKALGPAAAPVPAAFQPGGATGPVFRGSGDDGSARPGFRGGVTRGGRDGGDAAPSDDTAAGPAARGYLLTLRFIAFSDESRTTIEQKIVARLKADLTAQKAMAAGKPYYVGQAAIVAARQIKADPDRKTALRTAYAAKLAAKQAAEQAAATSAPGSDAGGAGSTFNRGPGGSDSGIRRAPIVPGGGFSRTVPGGGYDPTGGTGDDPKDPAFEDPLFPGENVLDDWEVTVMVAI